MSGVHVPACADLSTHIDAAVRETAGSFQPLDEFVDDVRSDWDIERQVADAGDRAVIAYWSAVEADWMSRMGVSL